MLSKNISKEGIELLERMLALPPDRRVAAKEALGSEWLRFESEGAAAGPGRGMESSTGLALPEERTFPMSMWRNSASATSYTSSNISRGSASDAMVPAEALGQPDWANGHAHHPDSRDSSEGGLPRAAEFPFNFDSGTPGYDQPEPPTPYILADENDKYLLSHFLDNVLPIMFPIFDLHVDTKRDVILPTLAANRCYRTYCLSTAALHLKVTQGLQGEWVDQAITRHRYTTISGLYDALARDEDHMQILEVTLGMILFQVRLGRAFGCDFGDEC